MESDDPAGGVRGRVPRHRGRGSGDALADAARPVSMARMIPKTISGAVTHQGSGQLLPDDPQRGRGPRTRPRPVGGAGAHRSGGRRVTPSVPAVAFTYAAGIYFSSGSFPARRPREDAVDRPRARTRRSGPGQASGGGNDIGRAGDPTEGAADRSVTDVIAALRCDAADSRPAVGLTGAHQRALNASPVGQPGDSSARTRQDEDRTPPSGACLRRLSFY